MIYILGIVLFILMCLVGGDRGAKSFLALCLNTGIFILSVLLLNRGIHPILILLLSAVGFCAITLFFQNGYNVKTLSAAVAVLVVIICVGCMIGMLLQFSHLTGYNELDFFEENAMYLSVDLNLNLLQITICAMVWGLLGAISDTGIAIATATNEVACQHPEFSNKKIFQSGMAVGRDIMGTTVNTLFFVGAGEAVMMALMYYTQKNSWVEIINSKSFFQELSMVVVSCIGCMLIIPLTAFIFSKFHHNKKISDHIEMVVHKHQ